MFTSDICGMTHFESRTAEVLCWCVCVWAGGYLAPLLKLQVHIHHPEVQVSNLLLPVQPFWSTLAASSINLELHRSF